MASSIALCSGENSESRKAKNPDLSASVRVGYRLTT